MPELIENAMIIGEDRILSRMYVTSDTPWDFRTTWDLYRFVCENDLEDAIRLAYLDEDDVDLTLDDLPEDVAIRLIERYVTDHGLTDRYDAWKRGA